MSLARLIIQGRGNWQHTFEIEKEGIYRLGRAAHNDVILNDLHASGNHSEILAEGGRFFLRDLESRNGTLLNGQKVEESQLNEGDQIRVGTTRIIFTQEPEEEFCVEPEKIRHESIDDLLNAIPMEDKTGGAVEPPREPEDLQRELREAQAAIKRMSIAAEFARLMALRSTKPLHLLSDSLRFIMHHVHAENGFTMQINPKTKSWEVRARAGDILDWTTTGEAENADVHLPMSLTMVEEVLRTGKAVISHSTKDDPRLQGSKSIESLGIQSCLCAPLTSEGKTVGVVYADRRDNLESFSRGDAKLFQLLVEQLNLFLYPKSGRVKKSSD